MCSQSSGKDSTVPSFRFNDLEIIPEQKEYRPGETVRLLINTNHVNATVSALRPADQWSVLPPKVVHVRGKSTVEEIGIVPRDMPNMFVEAIAVSDGKVHNEVREIADPTRFARGRHCGRASQKTYKPGQKATVKLSLVSRVRPESVPSLSSARRCLAVYDKSIEYISGGSNVPDIKEWFWKWKRSHHPQTESSLYRQFDNLWKQDEVDMEDLGIFHDIVSDEAEAAPGMPALEGRTRGMRGGMGGMVRRPWRPFTNGPYGGCAPE